MGGWVRSGWAVWCIGEKQEPRLLVGGRGSLVIWGWRILVCLGRGARLDWFFLGGLDGHWVEVPSFSGAVLMLGLLGHTLLWIWIRSWSGACR